MNRIKIIAAITVLFSSSAMAEISQEGQLVQNKISKGMKCTAVWSEESSKQGEHTNIYSVRELNGNTQYQVSYSSEYPKIWTWDFRIKEIDCKK